jgi:hypothetical protein
MVGVMVALCVLVGVGVFDGVLVGVKVWTQFKQELVEIIEPFTTS